MPVHVTGKPVHELLSLHEVQQPEAVMIGTHLAIAGALYVLI